MLSLALVNLKVQIGDLAPTIDKGLHKSYPISNFTKVNIILQKKNVMTYVVKDFSSQPFHFSIQELLMGLLMSHAVNLFISSFVKVVATFYRAFCCPPFTLIHVQVNVRSANNNIIITYLIQLASLEC